MNRTLLGAPSPTLRPVDRTMALSRQIDEILDSCDMDELREAAAVLSRGSTQACIQIGARRAEERQHREEQSAADAVEMTPKELSQTYGCSEHSIRQAVRAGKLTLRYPCPGAKRNGRVSVGEYRRWRES